MTTGEFILACVIAPGVWYLYQIFLEVRSIRRMMNADRHIPNELDD